MKNSTFAKQFKGKTYPKETGVYGDVKKPLSQPAGSSLRKRQGITPGMQKQAFPGMNSASVFPAKKRKK